MYLLITKRTINHEGDERSRTHPGHGYPAWSEEIEVVKRFDLRPSVLIEIERDIGRLSKYETYELFKAEKCSVTTKMVIDIK